jgi:two-component system response regulator AtoC
LAAKQTILPQHLPADISPSAKFEDDLIAAEQPFSIPQMTAQIEKKLIFEALAASHGNKAKAAKLLEISERSLWYKLDQLNFK